MIEFYTPFSAPITKQNYNELNVSVGYQKPQTNYFNGNFEKGGIYIYFKPITRKNGIIASTMLSASKLENGFKIKVIDLNRKNTKKMEKFAACVTDDILKQFSKYYENEDFDKILSITLDLAKSFK